MPIHKNATRQKKATFTFNGTYTRRDFENSSSYLGLPQDIWTAGTYPNLGIAENSLPLRFSGKSGGSERVETAPGDEDSLVVMCMNNADDAHEYSAEDVRDSALAALQATSGFNNATGLAYTPTQLGAWTKYDEVYSDYTTYDLIWNPNAGNTAAFADDHPVGSKPILDHFINALDTPEGVAGNFNTTFEPNIATVDVAAGTVELIFSEAPGSTALTNKYWAVGRRIGTDNDGGVDITPQWSGVVISRAEETNSTKVVLKVEAGISHLNDIATGVTNSILSLFTTGRVIVIHQSVTNLYMLDQVTTANLGYTAEGRCTEADINGDIIAGTGFNTVTQTGVRLLIDQTAWASIGNTTNQQITVRADGNAADKFTNGTATTDTNLNRFQFWNNVFGENGDGADRSGFRGDSSSGSGLKDKQLNANIATGGDGTDFWTAIADAINTTDNLARFADTTDANTGQTWGLEVAGTGVDGTNAYADFYWLDVDAVKDMTMTLDSTGLAITIDATAPTREVTSTIISPVTLSLADDPNRVGSVNYVQLLVPDYVNHSNGYLSPEITLARGASFSPSNGFTLDVGIGYFPKWDAKDGLLDISNNGKITYSGQHKENIYGGRFKRLTEGSNANTQDPILATEQNPMTVIQENSGSISMNLDPNAIGPTIPRTFLIGRASAQSNQSLQWIVKDSQTGLFSGTGNNFIYPVPGVKQGQTFLIDNPDGTGIYEPSNTIKQFTGDILIIGPNNASFQFNGGTVGSNTDAQNFTYGSQWIAGGMKILGLSSLGGFQPRNVNFTMFDLEDADGIYTGGWNFETRGAGTTGIVTLGRLWNPQWQYGGVALTGLLESYYYGTGSNATTLVAVKEGCEPEDIATVGSNNHPFDDAVTISSTRGLADTAINGTEINLYKSDNDGTSAGWGDTIDDYNGLMLVFTKGDKSLTTDGEDTKLDATQYDTDWFCYSRRDGYRPRIITNPFSGSKSSYQPVISMEPFLDIYWQASTVSTIDAYVATFETALWDTVPVYTSGTTTLAVDLPQLVNANELYRFIEYSENNGKITNANLTSETRAFDTINGRFRRFIDTTVPVTTDGDINITDYNLDLTFNTGLVRSTGSNPIRGIDVGNTNTIKLTAATGGENLIKLDLRAKNFTFVELNGDITAEDAVFTNVDAQTYPIDMETSVINSTGAPTLSGVTSSVTVNTNAATIVSGVSTDFILNGTGPVSISANSTDGRYGTALAKSASITYSSSAVSSNDTGHTSGNLVLPNVSSDANFNVDGNITRAGTSGTTTDPDLVVTGNAEMNAVDGGNVTVGGTFRAHSSVNGTTIQATGDVTLDANLTGSTGIGVNGDDISVGGDTDSSEVNAVKTFTTNDIKAGSDVSAGTSIIVKDINNSVATSPVVECDNIENTATVVASTSLDVGISMTGGTATSPTIDIVVDMTGGTATASGNFNVPLISGSTTTVNAGELDTTTLTSGFVNLSGLLSTIDTVNGGIINGTVAGRTLTIANRITGGSFGANLTLLSMPTNTSFTRHAGNYSDTRVEFTNPGIVEFEDSATGVITATRGPTSTVEQPAFNTQNIWEDSSTAGHFLLLRFGGATVAGGSGSTAYSGTRVDNGNPYYTTSGRTWELRQTGDIFFERGVQQAGTDNYAIIRHTVVVVVVRTGGTTVNLDSDNGTNFTDNILTTEDPFNVSIVFPDGGTGRVKFGGVIYDGVSFEEDLLDRGDTIEVAWVKPGSDMFYQTFTVPVNLPENDTFIITVTDTADPYPNNEPIPTGTQVNSVVFTNAQLVVNCNNIVPVGKVINKLLMESLMGTTFGLQTILVIFDQQSATFFRSIGSVSGFACDPDIIKMTSATAVDSSSPFEGKEITSFYEDTQGRAVNAYIDKLTDLDRDLFSITVRTELTIDDFNQTLDNRGVTKVAANNLQKGVEDASRIKPTTITRID